MLSEQIARYRKERGMTQEELGKRVGVSTQAVSRWECGGAPDVALLPAIADTLDVTVDALFGRESGPRADPAQLVGDWLRSLPPKRRLQELCLLVWRTSTAAAQETTQIVGLEYFQPTCELYSVGNPRPCLMRSSVALDIGLVLSVAAEDMSFISVFPEPERGYDAYFLPNDDSRRLFAVLARPGCLEAWLLLARTKTERFHTAKGLAARMGVDQAEAEALLEAMAEVSLLTKSAIELDETAVDVYALRHEEGLVPLLYLTRWLAEDSGTYFLGWNDRPVMLPDRGGQGSPAKDKENAK